MSELYLIRHARASFGSDSYDCLSAPGYRQSRLLGRYFCQRDITFDHRISGDLQRHRQTLKAMEEEMGDVDGARCTIHPGFNEYDFESMMRCYREQHPDDDLVRAQQQNPSDTKAYFRLLRRVLSEWGHHRLEGVPETWTEFERRVLDARAAITTIAGRGDRVLAISSGGAISAFIGSVLGLSPEAIFDLNLQLRNTAICHFYFNREKFSLSGFNWLPHLDSPDRVDLVTYG